MSPNFREFYFVAMISKVNMNPKNSKMKVLSLTNVSGGVNSSIKVPIHDEKNRISALSRRGVIRIYRYCIPHSNPYISENIPQYWRDLGKHSSLL